MAQKSDPALVPFSAKLTPDENGLLLALRSHIEARSGGKTIKKSDVLRLALECLAAKEKRNGFEHV